MINYRKLKKMAGTVKQREIAAVWNVSIGTVQMRLKPENIKKMSLEHFEALCQLIEMPVTEFVEDSK